MTSVVASCSAPALRLQWLVFRDEGTVSAMAWAQAAAEASARDGCVGDSDVGDILQPRNPMLRRRGFVMTLMRQIMEVRCGGT